MNKSFEMEHKPTIMEEEDFFILKPTKNTTTPLLTKDRSSSGNHSGSAAMAISAFEERNSEKTCTEQN